MEKVYAGKKFKCAGFQHDELDNEAGIYFVLCKERPRIVLYLGRSDKVRDHVESRNTDCWERYCLEEREYIAPFIYYVHYTPDADEDERLAIMKEVKRKLGNVRCKDEDSTS